MEAEFTRYVRNSRIALVVLALLMSGVLAIEAGSLFGTAYRDADRLEVSVYRGELRVSGRNRFNLYGMSDGPFVITHVFGPTVPKGKTASAALPIAMEITGSEGISIPVSGLDWRFQDGTKATPPDPDLCEVLYHVPKKSGR